MVGGNQNESVFFPPAQRIGNQASSIYGLYLPLCYAFIYLLRKWPSDMSENQPSKLLTVAVWKLLTVERESTSEWEHEKRLKGRRQAHCWQQTSKTLFSAEYLDMENKFSNSLLLFIDLNMSQQSHDVASRKGEWWSVWDETFSLWDDMILLLAIGKASAEQHVHIQHCTSRKMQTNWKSRLQQQE